MKWADSDFSWILYDGERARRVYSEGDFSEALTYNIQFAVHRYTSSWVNYLWDLLGAAANNAGGGGHWPAENSGKDS